MPRLSGSQIRTLRWIANNSVWNELLDRPSYGNKRRVVRSLHRAGLVELDVGGLIRPSPAGWAVLTGKKPAEGTGRGGG